MASKPTEMCVVEKSGAREYKVMCSSFFRLSDESRVVLEEALSSIIAIALRLLVFSLSLSAVVVARSPSLPLVDDVWRLREEVERLARSVRASTISSSAVPSSQKLGAKRRAPPGNDWIDEKSVESLSSSSTHSRSKSRAIQSRRSRRARTRWNHLCARLAWEMDLSARIERDVERAVVDGSSSARRRRSVESSLF